MRFHHPSRFLSMLFILVVGLILQGCASLVIEDEKERILTNEFEHQVFKASCDDIAKVLSEDELGRYFTRQSKEDGTCQFGGPLGAPHLEAPGKTGGIHFFESETFIKTRLFLWKRLDPDGFKKHEEKALAEARDYLQSPFNQRTGPMGGVFISIGKNFGFGVRGGARHWLTRTSAIGANLEYEGGAVYTKDGDQAVVLRLLSAAVEFEFAPWTHWTAEHYALPETSLYLNAAPIVNLGEGVDGNTIGWRTGLGAHFNRYSDSTGFSPPIFTEIRLQKIQSASFKLDGVWFLAGLGF